MVGASCPIGTITAARTWLLDALRQNNTATGTLTVMVIAKSLSGSTPATIALANSVHGGTAQAWQLTAANAITRLPDFVVSKAAVEQVVSPVFSR